MYSCHAIHVGVYEDPAAFCAAVWDMEEAGLTVDANYYQGLCSPWYYLPDKREGGATYSIKSS